MKLVKLLQFIHLILNNNDFNKFKKLVSKDIKNIDLIILEDCNSSMNNKIESYENSSVVKIRNSELNASDNTAAFKIYDGSTLILYGSIINGKNRTTIRIWNNSTLNAEETEIYNNQDNLAVQLSLNSSGSIAYSSVVEASSTAISVEGISSLDISDNTRVQSNTGHTITVDFGFVKVNGSDNTVGTISCLSNKVSQVKFENGANEDTSGC